MNWEIIYESALGNGLPVVVLYQICTMVAEDPAICQMFLRLLLDQLAAETRDPFLLQAITNVVELQPNSAGNLWRVILEESTSQLTSNNASSSSSSSSPASPEKLNLSLILHLTKRLTDDNFYQFSRELSSQLSITSTPLPFIEFMDHNRGRISSIGHLLLTNF